MDPPQEIQTHNQCLLRRTELTNTHTLAQLVYIDTYVYIHTPLFNEECFKIQISCTWAVHIYGPNSEVYWEYALVNFWMLVSDSWKGLPVWLTSCPISVPALPKTGTSYKTVVFFIFLLMFVSSLIFRPISDFLVSGKWGEIEAGLVSLCLNLLLIDTLLRDLKRVQTYYYRVLWTKQTKNQSMFSHWECLKCFQVPPWKEKKEMETINKV